MPAREGSRDRDPMRCGRRGDARLADPRTRCVGAPRRRDVDRCSATTQSSTWPRDCLGPIAHAATAAARATCSRQEPVPADAARRRIAIAVRAHAPRRARRDACTYGVRSSTPGSAAPSCVRRLRLSGSNTVVLELLERIEAHIRRHELIEPGGEVLCLVSGGADSTCLFHALRELGYRVSALHVDHGLRGAESDDDARFCAERFGADGRARRRRGATEAELRDLRYAQRARPAARDRPHALATRSRRSSTGSSTSGDADGDQAAARGRRRPAAAAASGARRRRRSAASAGSSWRIDSSNPDTVRGLIRDEILPLLERIHPAARENILRALDERRTMPPALAELLDAPAGSRRVDLGGGVQAVREHDRLWLERGPVELAARSRWGDWRIRVRRCQGLRYAGGGPATGSPAARRRSRTCSSTQRSRAPTAKAGRSSCAATRSSRCPGSSRRRE